MCDNERWADVMEIDLGEFKNDFFCNFKNVILELKYEPNLDSSVRKMIDNIKVRYVKILNILIVL